MDLVGGFQRAVRRYLVLRGASSSFVSVAGHAVHHYHVVGKGHGAPIVLVHGLGGNSNGFSRTLFGLAERFSRVWALDLPGNGFSPLPASGALPLPEQLGVLAGFCETVVREPAIVIGNSLGGSMSVLLAAIYPQRVRALILVAPAGARVAETRIHETLASVRVQSTADARRLMHKLFHRPPLPVLLAAPVLKTIYTTPAVQGALAELSAAKMLEPETLAGLKMPILLIWGRSEKLLPYEGVDFFRAHLPPHAELQVVEGFGHVPQVERPDELVRRIVQFADAQGL